MPMGDHDFASVAWANGDHISTSKMSQEVENDKFLYYDASPCFQYSVDSYSLNKSGGGGVAPVISGTSDDYFGVRLSGTTVQRQYTTGSVSWDDIDISNTVTYPLGITEIDVGFVPASGNTISAPFTIRFLKTKAHNRMSVRGSFFRGVAYDSQNIITSFAVFLHPDTQANLGW